jgi:hypothetical protein
MTASLNERFIKTVGRHFVTLSCVRTLPGASTEKIFVFSGFLAEVGGAWFYVTAGHILRDIRAALSAGTKFDIWRFGDQTAGNRFQDTAIPYAFDVDRWLVIEDEESGLDYATVVLEDMYCELLKAGNAIAIDQSAWGDHVTEHDQWALVGIPSESVSYDGKTIISARVVVVPLEQVDQPAAAGSKARNQFYARLSGDSPGVVKDIDGMSGGPIFALKKIEGMWKYTVIGVQSGWYPSNQIITACPFVSLGVALEQVISDVRAEQARDAT